ncbi:MAG: thioredoxin family protein [Actinomycetota bacterium]|nr:thioredoxin family protein [Actinomycetota bacterium]
MTGALVEATRDNFRDLVSEGITLVDLWGTDCQTCMALMPDVERLAEEKDGVKVVTLEAPKARRLCMELKVLGLPAFLLFRDGEEVGRLAGPDLTASKLEAWLDENLEEVS